MQLRSARGRRAPWRAVIGIALGAAAGACGGPAAPPPSCFQMNGSALVPLQAALLGTCCDPNPPPTSNSPLVLKRVVIRNRMKCDTP
jgi:hypothetical protein